MAKAIALPQSGFFLSELSALCPVQSIMGTLYEDGVIAWLIDLQRKRIERMLNRTPSLRAAVSDLEFLQDAWLDALIKVVGENGCYDLPETSPWSLEQALAQDFFPDYLPS